MNSYTLYFSKLDTLPVLKAECKGVHAGRCSGGRGCGGWGGRRIGGRSPGGQCQQLPAEEVI